LGPIQVGDLLFWEREDDFNILTWALSKGQYL
jgi:hypothetical protein